MDIYVVMKLNHSIPFLATENLQRAIEYCRGSYNVNDYILYVFCDGKYIGTLDPKE
jgi:hypothetical protein